LDPPVRGVPAELPLKTERAKLDEPLLSPKPILPDARVPGESCAYTFISVPLHGGDLVDADALVGEIGGVCSVNRYN
jgi:hypothetical protein